MSSQPHRAVRIPGDGLGPEVAKAAGRGVAPPGVKIDACTASPIELLE
jgi:isocitrate/isopropylmalate dehydrogenase